MYRYTLVCDFRRVIVYSIYDVEGTILCLGIDTTDILADESEDYKLDPTEHHHCYYHCRPPLSDDFWMGEFQYHSVYRVEYREKRYAHTEKCSDFERLIRKRSDPIYSKADHLRKRIMCITKSSLISIKFYISLLKSYPAYQSSHETRVFLESLDLIDDFSIHQSKVPSIKRNIYSSQIFQYAIEPLCRYTFKKGIFSCPSLRVDDIVSVFPFMNHIRYYFRAVLKVSIHDDDSISGSIVNTSRYCYLVSEIPGEINDFYMLIL